MLAAGHASSLLAANGQVTDTSDRELLTKNYVTGTLSAQRGFQEGLLARVYQRDVDFTIADRQRMIDFATAAKNHAVAVATAEADYQYNLVDPAEPTWTDGGERRRKRDRLVGSLFMSATARCSTRTRLPPT